MLGYRRQKRSQFDNSQQWSSFPPFNCQCQSLEIIINCQLLGCQMQNRQSKFKYTSNYLLVLYILQESTCWYYTSNHLLVVTTSNYLLVRYKQLLAGAIQATICGYYTSNYLLVLYILLFVGTIQVTTCWYYTSNYLWVLYK